MEVEMIMSGRIVAEVFRYAPEDLKQAELTVLVALATLAHEHDRTARKGSDVASLAYLTRLGAGTVRNALSSLASRALIQPLNKARKGLSQDYRITPLSEHHRETQRHLRVTQKPAINGTKASLTDDAKPLESVTPR